MGFSRPEPWSGLPHPPSREKLEPRPNHVFPLLGQVKAVLEEILERVTDEFNLPELMARVEERTPYVAVMLQECERMNVLTREMQRSLQELDLGLKVGEARLGWGSGELEHSSHSSLTTQEGAPPRNGVWPVHRDG